MCCSLNTFQDVTLIVRTETGTFVEVKTNGTVLALSSEYFFERLSKGEEPILITGAVPDDLRRMVRFV